MKQTILVYSALLAMAAGASPDDHLNYNLPKNALKSGPHSIREPEKKEVLYFSGAEMVRENLVAIEVFERGVLIGRELLKDGRKHGVQREWHPNGKRRLEAPYKDGIMEGTFRVWNESGDLIGQYRMSSGTGIVLVYDSRGDLMKEDHYRANVRDGLRMERIGDKISLTWSKDGHQIGKGFDFFDGGDIATIVCFADDGVPNGPAVYFTKGGQMRRIWYYIRGQRVDAATYEAAPSKDSTLPPYYADANRYKEMVSEDIRALVQKYRTMPRVRIPLRFDRENNPVLAR